MRAYTTFLNEIISLEEFYSGTKYSYAQTENAISFWRDNKLKFDKESDFGLRIDKPTNFKTKKRYKNIKSKILREIVYVRLISALEVFLTDSIRDVFLLNKEPFKREDIKHQFSQRELLSMDSTTEIFNRIINKECRKLSSGGFKDVVKFYKRNLKIDIGNIQPGTSRMEEIHTRRHLLVHKLGKTDKTYRKKYNTTALTVEISEDYLLEVVDDFKSFATLVNNQIKYKLDTEFNYVSTTTSSDTKRLEIEITHPKNYEFEFLQQGYEFWAGDEYSKSETIIEKIDKVNEYTTIVILDGDKDLIKKLFRFIKRKCKKLTFDYKLTGTNQNNNFEQNILDEDLVLKIKSKLPEQPWPKGIHKLIAKELNISNNLSSIGIQQLIVNGDFKRQIGQRIVE